MEDFLDVVARLSALALILFGAFAVVCLARRRPWTVAAVIGVVVAAGVVAVWFAAREGFGYDPALKRVQFGSQIGRRSFGIGLAFLTLGCPAWLLVASARTRNGPALGPRGPQWVAVLFGYWMACLIFGMVLYSWLTGAIK